MGFIEDNLLDNERVIHLAKFHWSMLVFPIIVGGTPIFLGLIVVLVSLLSGDSEQVASGVFLSFCCFVMGFIVALPSIVNYKTSQFAITNKRIIGKTGVLRRHSIELLLTKVESITTEQRIIERMLGSGSLVVSGSGGTKTKFPHIAEYVKLRKHIQEQIALVQDKTP
jgi:uncharacterized membrane protein YdbT with pleckstrin-like domain